MIDVSVLIELTEPPSVVPLAWAPHGHILGFLVLAAGALSALMLTISSPTDSTGSRNAARRGRKRLWPLRAALIGVLAFAVSLLVTGMQASDALRDAHQREVKTYEQSAAARERETKRAEKVITSAIEDQYKVDEARTGWGRTDDWQSARKALSASKMDAPRVTVVTEDNRRGFVLVEYDNASGEVTLLSDTSDRQQGSKGIDVTGLRR